MATPGIILVGHEVLDSISQEEMLAALPTEYRDIPREHVSLSSVKTSLRELDTLDWITARNRQQAEVTEKLEPVIRAHTGWRLQYFGAAPIPLAIALGYQLSGWTNVDVYQKLHEGDRSWKWPSADATPDLLRPLELGTERLKTDADILVRVSFSAEVYADDTVSIVSEPLGQVDLIATQSNEDLLRSPADLEAAAAAFSKVLDWAHDYRPNAQIHLLAAVPVGAAFRMGMCINPTIHGKVQTYQYFGNRHERAFVLQDSARAEPPLTDADRSLCAATRAAAVEELAALKAFATQLTEGSGDWLERLFGDEGASSFSKSVKDLASAHLTPPLRESSVDETSTDTPDGFRYTEQNRWELSDRFLHVLRQYLPSEGDQRLALRLFFLHESIHRSTQRLRQSLQIRRFPKVVEELDYQADVWAYLHELARQRSHTAPGFSVRSTLMEIIRVAVGTFWAFASATDPSRMEVRIVNRYLIWYWKRLQIEALSDDKVQLAPFLEVMAEKPAIEIAGARIRVIDDRLYFLLDQVSDAEIAVLSHSKLHRFGHGNGSPVADIFRGFRERDDDLILKTLRAIADQVI